MSTGVPGNTIYFHQDSGAIYLIPDAEDVPPGDVHLRTAAGRERSADESAVLQYEVTGKEARAWAKEQLGDVLGKLRGEGLGLVGRLRERTAELREENRLAWQRGIAEARPEVRNAVDDVREGLRDLGEALRRAARARGAVRAPGPPAEGPSDPEPQHRTERP